MKEIALKEPLVDTVEMKALVTDPCPVITFDLNTVTPADLSFRVPYSLTARRSDFIHALIAWFDIEFSACHKPICFSTGPHAKYTHWKQTVFYLRDVLTIEEEEKVSGYLENRPNDKNKRDLDIHISYKFEITDPTRFAEGDCFYRMYVFCQPGRCATYANFSQVLISMPKSGFVVFLDLHETYCSVLSARLAA